MNINTEITTAARRIVRELHSGTPGMLYYFDAEGREVHAHMANLSFASAAAREEATAGAVVAFQTNDAITQRTVQDHLDAAAAHPGDRDAQGYYLHALEIEREMQDAL